MNKWWRFSDINVSQVDEEMVFKEAYGGQPDKSQKTAYSLIYVNAYCLSLINQEPVSPFLMGGHLKNPLEAIISKENTLFSQQVQTYNQQKLSNAIVAGFN